MKNNLYKAFAAAALAGSLVLPLAASAQVGPVPVINALTAGMPYVTYGFGSAYGAPASAYYATDPWEAAYAQEYGYGGNGYGSYGYAYPQSNFLSQLYPQGYSYQPYWGGYNQAYLPNYYGQGYGQQYGYLGGYGNGYYY